MPESTPAPDLAARLLPRLSRLTRTLARGASSLSRPQIAVLVTLRDDGPTRISALATRERVMQPTMTALVNRLERHGLVSRGADAADLRAVPVSITDAGRAALARAVGEIEAVLAGQIDGLSAADRRALAAVIPVLDRLTPTT